MIRILTVLLFMLCLATTGKAQYKPVEQESDLKFTIKNLGFDVEGTLAGFEGNISFDIQNLAGSSFDVTVAAATINTGNSLRDDHLRGENYFDAKNYPKIRLVSEKITLLSKSGTYRLSGKLTMKGVIKPVSFPFTVVALPGGYNFKGSFKINRRYFGIGGTSTLADELEVNINVTAKKA
ncbi:YceI family protein [Mucilaginibacter celer]|nr:YceI family protein [Mucilaginibacter celer]